MAHLSLVLLPGGVSGQQQRLRAICELLLLAHLALVLFQYSDLGGFLAAALLTLAHLALGLGRVPAAALLLLANLVLVLLPVTDPGGVPGQQQRQRAVCQLLLLAYLALVLLPGPDLCGVIGAALLLLAYLTIVLFPGSGFGGAPTDALLLLSLLVLALSASCCCLPILPLYCSQDLTLVDSFLLLCC